MLKKNLVISIYSPPEYYPPTLNAIEYLSGIYENIYVVFRNYDEQFDWTYPENVHLIQTGKKIHVRKAEAASVLKKVQYFFQYSRKLLKTIRRNQPDTILLYDYFPVLAYRLISPFIRKPATLWYHNHDVGDSKVIRKGSLSWAAWKSENWIFPRIQIFSLPSVDRQAYFPMEELKGRFFFLPNYPSVKVFNRYARYQKSYGEVLRIVYQGSIGPLHGLEEIIRLLGRSIRGKQMELIVRGFISEEYKKELLGLAAESGVSKKLQIIPPGSYSKVIEQCMAYHIGIGIHRKDDIMNKTLGTSSNKIYEYAAAGLPVILYDNQQFRNYLGKYNWAFFTDCSEASLISIFETIERKIQILGNQARMDFENELNFEKYFAPVCQLLNA
ncbi:MAG TPA: hypothetical protein VK711_15205 [Puia sp.]|nr:hypothetical protein [Puia sp.]